MQGSNEKGDLRVHGAARSEARRRFEDARGIDPGAATTELKIEEARQVARMLRQNVVQGAAADGDQRYGGCNAR